MATNSGVLEPQCRTKAAGPHGDKGPGVGACPSVHSRGTGLWTRNWEMALGWGSGPWTGWAEGDLQATVLLPPHRHPHLHGPLSLAPGCGPAAGRLPRLHPRGPHQQRAAGLQGPPATVARGVARLQVLHRVPARPVPLRGEGQRGVRVSPGLDRPPLRPGGPGPLPRPQVSVPRPFDGSWRDCGQTVDRTCGSVAAEARRRPPAAGPAPRPRCAPRTRPCGVEKGSPAMHPAGGTRGIRPCWATLSLCGAAGVCNWAPLSHVMA